VPVKITFGRPDEQQSFLESHPLFFERFPNLQVALEIAFQRLETRAAAASMIIFFLGRLSVDDFNEILLLCGNGYGTGAMKLLRGMYERVVTARHLHTHPEEVPDFLDFYWVNAYKLAQAIENVFGKGQLSAGKVAELASRRNEVALRFMVTDCKKCGTQRLNFNWNKLDFVSMARATGPTGKRIVDAYYLPLEQTHSTFAAIASRLKESDDGTTITFGYESQKQSAVRTLITAHNLILDVLTLQMDHFELTALEEPLHRCFRDFEEIWARSENSPA
jgi:hypothetical protein